MRIAVLAVQGSFLEHRQKVETLGAQCVELRQRGDLEMPFDGLILPSGESTVQGKLLRELGMFEALKDRILQGMPVLATCAGLILLAGKLSNDGSVYFGTLPVTVRRNAYGRQLGSFHVVGEMKGVGQVPMTFIRAPYIEDAGEGVEILAQTEGKITAVRYGRQYGMSFHPELDEDLRIHQLFLRECGMDAQGK